MNLYAFLGAGALVAAALPALPTAGEGTCSSTTSAAYAGEGKDIVATAVEAGSFKTLAAALQAGGLVEALQGKGPFTVFAPTDEAFAKLPKGTVETLLKPENKALLVDILKYHVVSGKVTARDVVKLTSADALNGQRLSILVEEGTVEVAGATVIKADVMASNGVIHVIDTVMMPATKSLVGVAAEAGSFRTLLAAAKAAGLAETLDKQGPFTIFAPTDEAFAKLPEGTVESLLLPENKDKLAAILKYHVVSGRVFANQVVGQDSVKTLQGGSLAIRTGNDKVMVGKAQVVATDIQASNGVIHVIDSVLLPE
jgi:transforming growth factor-beta-induced protein